MKFLACLCSLFFGFAPFGPLAADTPVVWPEEWVHAYERFERFREVRQEEWPHHSLFIDSRGRLETKKPSEDKTLVVFYNGAKVLGRAVEKSFAPFDYYLSERRYAVYVRVWTPYGYQSLGPILWLSPKKVEGGSGMRSPFQWVPVAAPEEPSRWWPNQRGLDFLDFHILPDGHPDEIYENNLRVTPSCRLQADLFGRIRLDIPPETAPYLSSLHWRVFRNGQLVEDGPVQRTERYEPEPAASGKYLAFIAIEGPEGILPVSNFVRYYLWPEEWPDGRLRIHPKPEHFPNGKHKPRALTGPPHHAWRYLHDWQRGAPWLDVTGGEWKTIREQAIRLEE